MPAEAVERKLVAILAADIAGFSRLVELDEEVTLGRLKTLRRDLIDPTIAEHRGRIVKTTGDGMLVEFASVVDAVRCAVAVQRATVAQEAPLPQEQRIEFRVGINLGDIVVEGDDILGDGVNIAARLEGIAEPSGICLSEDAYRQVRGKVAAEFADLGEQTLKNIARPLRAYRVLLDKASAGTPAALPLPDKPSIAVLPFQNISGDPEQEHFADGMVEDITTALSKLRWFFVIARNSAFAYKGRAVDVKQVGRELGVCYILEGSVRRGGNRLRITAQLVDASSGNHVWAERYDRDLADIFAVQDEITERVVAAIEPELYAAEHIRSQRKPPDSLDAWECVIRALSLIGQGTQQDNAVAEELCRRAITIAPGYAQAHSLLAWALLRRGDWSGGIQSVLPEANEHTRTALRLDERDPWAHLSQAVVLFRMRNHGEAEQAFRRALELNPNFALAHARLGHTLVMRSAKQEAIDSVEHALRLSPADRHVGTYASITMAHVHLAAEHYPECATWARRAIEKSPEWPAGHAFLTASLALEGDLNSAAAARDALLRVRPEYSLAWVTQNTPMIGPMADRLIEGLRKAGVPET